MLIIRTLMSVTLIACMMFAVHATDPDIKHTEHFSFNTLPNDINMLLASYLDPDSLIALAQTERTGRAIVANELSKRVPALFKQLESSEVPLQDPNATMDMDEPVLDSAGLQLRFLRPVLVDGSSPYILNQCIKHVYRHQIPNNSGDFSEMKKLYAHIRPMIYMANILKDKYSILGVQAAGLILNWRDDSNLDYLFVREVEVDHPLHDFLYRNFNLKPAVAHMLEECCRNTLVELDPETELFDICQYSIAQLRMFKYPRTRADARIAAEALIQIRRNSYFNQSLSYQLLRNLPDVPSDGLDWTVACVLSELLNGSKEVVIRLDMQPNNVKVLPMRRLTPDEAVNDFNWLHEHRRNHEQLVEDFTWFTRVIRHGVNDLGINRNLFTHPNSPNCLTVYMPFLPTISLALFNERHAELFMEQDLDNFINGMPDGVDDITGGMIPRGY